MPLAAVGAAAALSSEEAEASKLLKTINPYKDLKPEVRFNLYSKAEEPAYKMPQAKQIGSDAKRYFLKQGVTKDEIDALG